MNRLDAGHSQVINPYNQNARRVSLSRHDVDGIVLWTKNLGPLVNQLPSLTERGYAFYVQYTVTNYPRELELSVTSADRAIDHIRVVSRRWGRRSVVWRYDPILMTDKTPFDWHVENFSRLSERIKGYADEVVVSFTQFYNKTRTNLNALGKTDGLSFYDPSIDEKRSLLDALVQIARSNDLDLTVCSQPDLLVPMSTASKCVDALRLSDIKGVLVRAQTKGNRPGCECAQSVDIGEYDTCPHGCVYCYAVRNRDLARERHRNHDSESECIFGPTRTIAALERKQLDLFEV
jgi:hypothetical protein